MASKGTEFCESCGAGPYTARYLNGGLHKSKCSGAKVGDGRTDAPDTLPAGTPDEPLTKTVDVIPAPTTNSEMPADLAAILKEPNPHTAAWQTRVTFAAHGWVAPKWGPYGSVEAFLKDHNKPILPPKRRLMRSVPEYTETSKVG